jgi:ATP-dependent Clp protease adaptor protein ClpS
MIMLKGKGGCGMGLLAGRSTHKVAAASFQTRPWRCSVIVAGTGMDGGVVERPTLPGLTPKKDSEKKRPPVYKVLLHNDDYNKREYVVQVLLKCVEGYTVEDALNVMQEAHIYGIALVTECSQEQAETTCEGIRNSGLICTIEPK